MNTACSFDNAHDKAIMWRDSTTDPDAGRVCRCCQRDRIGLFQVDANPNWNVTWFNAHDMRRVGDATPMWNVGPYQGVGQLHEVAFGVLVFVVILMTCFTVQRVYKMGWGAPKSSFKPMEVV